MKDETKDKLLAALAWFVVLVAIIAMCLPLGGCSTPKEIEKVYVHDTLYQNKVVHDSVDRWHTHYEVIEGSTKYVFDTFYQDRWHLQTDTVHATEIVTQTETKIVEVEKPLGWWQKLFIGLGIMAVVAVVGWIVYKVVRKRLPGT